MTFLSSIVCTMAVDGMVMQGARASAAMVMTLSSMNNLAPHGKINSLKPRWNNHFKV